MATIGSHSPTMETLDVMQHAWITSALRFRLNALSMFISMTAQLMKDLPTVGYAMTPCVRIVLALELMSVTCVMISQV